MPRRRVAPAQRVRGKSLPPELETAKRIARRGKKQLLAEDPDAFKRATLRPIDEGLKKNLSTFENKVAFFMSMMASDKFVSGYTVYQVFWQTGLPMSSLKKAAAEASKRLRAEMPSTGDMVARWHGVQERAINKSIELGQLHATAKLQDTYAKVLRLFEDNKVSVNLFDLSQFLLESVRQEVDAETTGEEVE